MKSFAILTPLALLLTSMTATAGDVYRCVDREGTTYSDRPCEAAVRVPIDPAHGGIVLARASYVGEPMHDGRDAPIVPGMSPRIVYQRLGRPSDMSVRLEGITPTERWWYRGSDGTLTVTFQHGRVVAVQPR